MEHLENRDLELFSDEFKFPSRIVVFEVNGLNENINSRYLNWEKLSIQNHYAYCYNVRRVAKFGVCETRRTFHYSAIQKKIVKINFGFCGSSCQTPNMQNLYQYHYPQFEVMNRHQWKMKAIYHEYYDKDDEFSKYP